MSVITPRKNFVLTKITKLATITLMIVIFLVACGTSETNQTDTTQPENSALLEPTTETASAYPEATTPLPSETPELPPATQLPPSVAPSTVPPTTASTAATTAPTTTAPTTTATAAPATSSPATTTAAVTSPPAPPTTTSPPTTTNPPTTTTTTAPAFPRAPKLDLQPLYKFDSGPLSMAVHPADTDSEVLYFALRDGRVFSLKDGESQMIIDMRQEIIIENIFDELGLTGIVFSPDGNFLFTNSVTIDAADQHQYGWTGFIYEWPVAINAEGIAEISGARRLVLAIPQPYPTHNGGDLAFGPDGMLYIPVGDGGSAGDPLESGQNPQTLLGTILRINPNTDGEGQLGQGNAYRIPPDNPFADGFHMGVAGAPEVWIYGARNPWRISFDSETGDLWISDVGQNIWEEINLLPADSGTGRGANLGWNIYEGTNRYNEDNDIQLSNHTLPVWEYEHGPGLCSVTGGYVYRGTELSGYDGVYIYADYCGREIYGLVPLVAHQQIAQLPAASNPASFGRDNSGELYVMLLDRNQDDLDGWVYKLVESVPES